MEGRTFQSPWPKHRRCGLTFDENGWQKLRLVGAQRLTLDLVGDLRCGELLAVVRKETTT